MWRGTTIYSCSIVSNTTRVGKRNGKENLYKTIKIMNSPASTSDEMRNDSIVLSPLYKIAAKKPNKSRKNDKKKKSDNN